MYNMDDPLSLNRSYYRPGEYTGTLSPEVIGMLRRIGRTEEEIARIISNAPGINEALRQRKEDVRSSHKLYGTIAAAALAAVGVPYAVPAVTRLTKPKDLENHLFFDTQPVRVQSIDTQPVREPIQLDLKPVQKPESTQNNSGNTINEKIPFNIIIPLVLLIIFSLLKLRG